MKLKLSVLLTIIVATRWIASAQPSPDAPPPPSSDSSAAIPPAQAVIAPPPPVALVDKGVIDDALSTGSFVSPTALTDPAATVSLSAGLISGSDLDNLTTTHLSGCYSPTNNLMFCGTVLIPADDFRLGMLSAKVQVVKSGSLRVALHGDVLFSGDAAAGIVSGIATVCLDDACNSHASGVLGTGILNESSTGVPIVVSGAAAVQLVPHIKLVGELIGGFSSSAVGGSDDLYVGMVGFRFTRKQIGFNLGIATLMEVESADFPVLVFASVTVRRLN